MSDIFPLLTWEQLAKKIMELSPEERQKPANVFMSDHGECAGICAFDKTENYNGGEGYTMDYSDMPQDWS